VGVLGQDEEHRLDSLAALEELVFGNCDFENRPLL
jgi:hypothetical protein